MEDSSELEYQSNNKIFMIYSTEFKKGIYKFHKNEQLLDNKKVTFIDQKGNQQRHFIYSLILKNKYKKEPINLDIEKDKDKVYSTKIEISNIYPEIFLFKVNFDKKDNNDKSYSFTLSDLSYGEQFKLFARMRTMDITLGLSDNYYKYLCLSSINFINNQDKYSLDFLFYVFICSYCIQKSDNKEKLLSQFLKAVNIEKIVNHNIDIEYKKENKFEIKFCNTYLKYFDNVVEILKELVKIGGEENLEKIQLFLAYYYLKYSPKNFISLITISNPNTKNIFDNLTKNRKLFNDFTANVLSFSILDDAENISQIISILKYLPNMEEFFEEFISNEFFLKVSGLSEWENKFIDVLEIMKPKKTDDIEKIYNYFLIIIQMCEVESIMIFKLGNDFFLDYSKMYEKENLKNIKYIKEMYETYSTIIRTEDEDKKKMLEQLNNIYFETGKQLINQGNLLKNEQLINFFQESGKKEIFLSPDLIASLIDLKNASELFRNNFLNNDFKKFDLKTSFQKGFYIIIEKIFEKFESQADFLKLKNWKISPNVDIEVLDICINRITSILIKESKEKEKKNKKNILYTDLIDFLCNLFSISSRRFNNINEKLKTFEKEFPSSKLIEIYFRILHKGPKVFPISDIFNEHLKEYIQNNSGDGALSIWYKLVIIENSERVVYLYKNLKPEFAVQKEDFVEFPGIMEERIALFTYLYFAKYFTYNYITELDYYTNSIKARNELNKLTFEQGMKIYNNYNQFFKLFKVFIPVKQYKEENYYIEYTVFYDQLSSYKVKYDSLKSIYNYWNTFFPKSKKNEVESLRELINTLTKIPLDQFDSKKDNIDKFLSNLNQAQNGIKLHNSKIFMVIYNTCKNKFNNLNENEIFDKANEEFKKVKEWGTKENLKDLDEKLKSTLSNYYRNEKNNLRNELYFIQNYFELNKNDNENDNKFNVEDILRKIEEILPDIPDNGGGNGKNKDPVIPIPIPIIEPEAIKNLRKLLQDFLDFYKKNCSNDILILDEYIKFFKDLFENDKIIKLEAIYFENDVINIIKKIYFYGFEYNTQNYLGDKIPIYIINDFFDILDVYTSINRNNFSGYITKLFRIISDRFEFTGFNKDFDDLQNNLFSGIIENNKNKEKEFSKCFINILIREIKKGKIENKGEYDKIIKYIIDSKYLIDDCIPLINKIYEDKFFSHFKQRENKNIYINDDYLVLLDKYCINKYKLLKERLLYYFESNIYKIMTEKYENTFIKETNLRERIKQSVKFLETQRADCNKNITLLYVIAFIKVFLIKYINVVKENNNKRDDFFKDVFTKNNDILSYFVLKIYFDIEGNYFDLLTSDKDFEISENVQNKIKEDKEKKYFGFDYLFLPMAKNNINKYKDIISDITNNLNNKLKNDTGILSDMNSKTDILFCVITNLYLSKLNDPQYFKKDEYDVLFDWLNKKIDNNDFKINQHSKKILKLFVNIKHQDQFGQEKKEADPHAINVKDRKEIRFDNNKQLTCILFSLRIVLNTLSPDNKVDPFFYNLLTNTNNTINKNMNIINKFFNLKKNNPLENTECFQLIRYILLSHLIFAHLLGNINFKDFLTITELEIEEEKNIFKILSKEFDKILKLIRYKGIKSKYCIIYMNIIFDEIKSIQLKNILEDSSIKYLLKTRQDSHYFNNIKNYFEQNEARVVDNSKELNEFKKIIFEDSNYYNKLKEDSYLFYFTTPNFCTIDDFKYQYQIYDEYLPIIDYILSGKMDNIINILNTLPNLNSLINKNYNQYILKINKEDSRTTNINVNAKDINNFNSNIQKINEYLKININEISNNSRISDIINIKDNNIYKMYQSFSNIIKIFNDFLSNLKIYKDNSKDIQTLAIQDFSEKETFNLKNEKGKKISAYERLLQMIILYSKRNRYNDKEFNVYYGEKIIFDFETIENKLEKEIILGKKLLKNYQRLFIFSNEVYANERNNLLSDFIIRYPQIKNEEILKKFQKDLEPYEENRDDIINIYHNLQYIIIYLMKYYNNTNKNEDKNITLKNLSNYLNGYNIHKVLNTENYHIENIMELYEYIEIEKFDNFKEIFMSDQILNPNKLKNKKKKEIKKYFTKKKILINEDIITVTMKKYLLRYCLGNYEEKEKILNNLIIKNLFVKSDIWDEKIFNKKQFKKESKKLISLNEGNDYLKKYFLKSIFNIPNAEDESSDEENEDEEDEEDEDEEKSEENSEKDDDNDDVEKEEDKKDDKNENE